MPTEPFQWDLREMSMETEMYRKSHYSTPHRPALWKHLIAFTSPLTAEKPRWWHSSGRTDAWKDKDHPLGLWELTVHLLVPLIPAEFGQSLWMGP